MSIRFKNELVDILSKRYLLDKIIYLGKFKQGFSHQHCIIKTKNKKYFLKKFYSKGLIDHKYKVDFIFRSLEFFAQKGLPAIQPITTINNQKYFAYNGSCYALFPYIPNLKIVKKHLSKRTLESAGQMLARIHFVGKSDYPQEKRRIIKSWRENEFNRKLLKIMSVLNRKKRKDKTDKLFIEKTIESMNGIPL